MFRAAKLRSLLQADGKQISLLMSLFSPKPLVFSKKHLFLRMICQFSALRIVVLYQLFAFFHQNPCGMEKCLYFCSGNPMYDPYLGWLLKEAI